MLITDMRKTIAEIGDHAAMHQPCADQTDAERCIRWLVLVFLFWVPSVHVSTKKVEGHPSIECQTSWPCRCH